MLSLPLIPGAAPKPSVMQPHGIPVAPPEDLTTLQDLYGAIQRAHEAGDQEAVQSFQQDIQKHIATKVRPHEALEGMTPDQAMSAGFEHGVLTPVKAVQSMVGKRDEDFDESRKLINSSPQGSVGQEVGEQAVMLPIGGVLGKGISALRKVPLAGRLLAPQGVRSGIEGAALSNLDTTNNDERLERTAVGGALGGALGQGVAALRGASKGISGSVAPGARALQREGANLTLGQMAPTSVIRQVEEAGESLPGVGARLRAQSIRGKQSWQDTVLNRTPAPGETVPPRTSGMDLNARLNETNEGYGRAYKKLLGSRPMVPAKTMTGAPLSIDFKNTVADRAFDVTDVDRNKAASWLENQLTKTPLTGSTGEAMQNLRSTIRSRALDYFKEGTVASKEMARMYAKAADHVSEAIEAQLAPAERTALKATDKGYSRYKTVENAVAASKDMPDGFTPSKLQDSIAHGTPSGPYARGGGAGKLRDLSKAGREVFDVKSPATGARALTLGGQAVGGAIGGGLGYAVGGNFGAGLGAGIGAKVGKELPARGIAAANDSPTLKRLILGDTAPQRFMQNASKNFTEANRRRIYEALLRGSAYTPFEYQRRGDK